MNMVTIQLGELTEDEQNLRLEYDEVELQELAESIRNVGLINPLTVRETDRGYIVVAGHRRLRALRTMCSPTDSVPCVVTVAERPKVTSIMLVENLQRADLSPLEEAKGYLRLTTEFGLSVKQLSSTVGRRQQHIMDRLALLSLPEDVQSRVGDGVTLQQAVQLSKLTDEKKRKELFKDAAKGRLQQWSVDSALRSQQRALEVDAMAKAVAERMLDVRPSLKDWDVEYRHAEFDRDRSFDIDTIGSYVPQPDDLLVSRNGQVDVYRRLSDDEIAAAEVARNVGLKAGEEMTPWHDWKLRHSDWEDQCAEVKQKRAALYGAVALNLSASQRQQVVFELVDWCATQINGAGYQYGRATRVVRWLGLNGVDDAGNPLDQDALIRSFIDSTPGGGMTVWILAQYAMTGDRPQSATFDALLQERFESDGLALLPVFDEIEPWQDEAGVWVLDRPKELTVSPDDHLEQQYEDLTYVDDDDDWGDDFDYDEEGDDYGDE